MGSANSMFIVRHRKYFYLLSGIVVGLSLLSLAFFGLRFGIDFTGGALIEATYAGVPPERSLLEAGLGELELGTYSLRSTGENGYILRTRDLTPEEHTAVRAVFSGDGAYALSGDRFTSIGPVIGEELRNKALVALSLTIVGIILFVAFAFRKVSKPVSSWKYSLLSILALLHDIIIPVGLFAALGYFFGAEIDTLFVTALLVILGYSVNDTIVVFDRVRENLKVNKEKNLHEDFEVTVGRSLDQTLVRSINASVSVLLTLLALYFFGAESTQDFALALIAGVIAGAFSSVGLATPLLVTIERWQKKKPA